MIRGQLLQKWMNGAVAEIAVRNTGFFPKQHCRSETCTARFRVLCCDWYGITAGPIRDPGQQGGDRMNPLLLAVEDPLELKVQL